MNKMEQDFENVKKEIKVAVDALNKASKNFKKIRAFSEDKLNYAYDDCYDSGITGTPTYILYKALQAAKYPGAKVSIKKLKDAEIDDVIECAFEEKFMKINSDDRLTRALDKLGYVLTDADKKEYSYDSLYELDLEKNLGLDIAINNAGWNTSSMECSF